MSEPTIKPHRAPLPQATPFASFTLPKLDAPHRQAPMEVRVTVPATGNDLPVILLSHGHGFSNFLSSIRGNTPLVDFYAAHGFVVIQVTHQDSKTLGLDPDGPEGATFWRSRPQDLRFVLDHLDEIIEEAPGLVGRVDKDRIAVVGHSMGGHTAALLAGATMTDIHTDEKVQLSEPRLKAFIVIAAIGDGKGAARWLKEHYPEVLTTDYSTMTRTVLVIVGDKDFNPNFSTVEGWRADAYKLSPGPKTLLTVHGAEHIYGGITGWDADETTDENPARVAGMQRTTWAYLKSALYEGDTSWDSVVAEMARDDESFGIVESK